MSVKHVSSIVPAAVKDGVGVSRKILISPDEAPNFTMRLFTIQPGGKMPKHTNLVEHEQFVLTGSANVGIGDEIFIVHQGDVVFIPADEPHWYKNDGEDAFEFLCLVPNKLDKTTILE